MSLLSLRRWLAARLGSRYAPLLATLDRLLLVFGAAVASKAIASGLGIEQIRSLSYWHTILAAGVAAVVAAVQGLVTTKVTGDPAVLSLTSRTLRARRELGHRVEHLVTLRPPPAK